MNFPPDKWLLLQGGFFFSFPVYSLERKTGAWEKTDWSRGFTNKEKGVNGII